MKAVIMYDFENAENIYKELLKLFNGHISESVWNGNEDNVFKNEADAELYLEDDGIINIYAGYNSEYCIDVNDKYFNVEVVELSETITENISNIKNIIDKYSEWEFIY